MIVALTGKKQSGKSTAAKYLEEKYGFVRLNFKDALVKEIKERMPDLLQQIIKVLDATQYDGNAPWTVDSLFEIKPPIIRTLMQNYGTEVRRKDHEDYWVVKWLKEAQQYENVVVDDCRFLNEASAIRSMHGWILLIHRQDMESADTHQSETEMDQITVDRVVSLKTGEHDKLYAFLDKFTDGTDRSEQSL